MKYERIVVLTGAGISAESGIRTFRDANGLWENHPVDEVATPEGFARNPVLVWRFYSARRRAASGAQPNGAHLALGSALARAERQGARCLLITQNVDTLHERVHPATTAFIAMHGALNRSFCMRCGTRYADRWCYFSEQGAPETTLAEGLWRAPALAELGEETRRTPEGLPLSPCCGALLRPDIVWFGEMPYELDACFAALDACDLFVSIGTSGNVYPAAGFVLAAARARARTVCLNRDPPENRGLFEEHILGPATETVPEFFEGILGR